MRIAMFGMMICLASSTAIAQAAAVPNLVGTWKVTGEAAGARTGKAFAGFAAGPVLNKIAPLTLVIEKQEERGFVGYVLLPDGSKDNFAGVIKHDGKEALLSTDNGKGTIDFYGSEIEYCFLDDMAEMDVATCRLMQKAP